MMIIGCYFHTRYQQITILDEATGNLTEWPLSHAQNSYPRVANTYRGTRLTSDHFHGLYCAASFLISCLFYNSFFRAQASQPQRKLPYLQILGVVALPL